MALATAGVLLGACSMGIAPTAPQNLPGPTSSTSPAPTAAPGAPAGLEERTWVTQLADGSWVAGSLLGPERLTLSPERTPIAVGEQLVATVTPRDGGGTILRIVRLDGRPAVDVPLAFVVTSAAFAGGELLVTGRASGGGEDAGLVGVDPLSGSTRAVVAPGRVPADWARAVSTVVVADTAARAAVSFCLLERCRVLVVDVATGNEVLRAEIRGYPRGMSDEVVVYGSDPPSDLSGLSISTGETIWTTQAEEFQPGYVAHAAGLVQARLVDSGGSFVFEIVLIELQSGRPHVRFSAPASDNWSLWPEVSNDRVAVVGRGGRLQDIGAIRESATIGLVALDGDRLSPDVYSFPLRSPGG